MFYFTTGKVFLTPSFDLDVKEEQKMTKLLVLLESSGVGNIISKEIKNQSGLGGRPNCNYYRLLATILYGFSNSKYTVRKIEEGCKYDLRYIFLMEQVRVDYSTISKFIKKIITPHCSEIFSLICKQIAKEMNISFDDAFIDGTKYEANANKYKFVWKPITFHKKISIRANEIIKSCNLFKDFTEEEMIKSKTISLALELLQNKKDELEEEQYNNSFKGLSAILNKVLEYEEKESICGENRKSYYKTDHDATAMCLKSDYYSGLGSNMHAAYNSQILVIKGLIFSYYVSQSRNDINDFIAIIDYFHQLYGCYPLRICADAGYGSLENYKYLKNHNIGNYVKHQSWEGNVSGRNPDCYHINQSDTITCLNGKTGNEVIIINRHPRKKNAVFYRVDGCNECKFKMFCKKYMKDTNDDYKIFEVVKEFEHLKAEAVNNLLSVKGIEMRVNRSIQVEGTFGIQKQDYERSRIHRRGLENVSTECMLNYLGMNIAKYLRFCETEKNNDFWIAPKDLKPQAFAKVSWKRLSKKGERINKNMKENYYDKK